MGTIDFRTGWKKAGLPQELVDLISKSPELHFPVKRTDLLDWALGRKEGETDWTPGNRADRGTYEVAYDVPGKGKVVEAEVVKAANGLSVNFPDVSMRRRDPNAMVIADALPTDKPRFKDRFGKEFAPLRQEIFSWLSGQPLVVMPFYAGPAELNYYSLLICPLNASFFAGMLADLQGFIPADQVPGDFKICGGVVFVAPSFRHTAFDGKQIVVHNRLLEYQEIFSTNLYPGPSAKKGIYSCLLHQGEKEGWVTNHCSAVQVETPYDNIVTFMHEGASGGGKSEMLEHVHRESDGRLLLGTHVVTGEKRHFVLPTACKLYPMMDDMGAAHPKYNTDKHLHVADAEDGWFIRTDNILHYGTDPHMEAMCLNSEKPLIYLNHFVQPGGLALIWEHEEDAPGKRCPNPRVIVPREMNENIRSGDASVDVRSFGVRCPPTTRENPNYGIMGLFHVIPPALSWLWRLTAPRGHANPAIQDVGGSGMKSEGVGSYWPFCTGRKVDQANLLLRQIVQTPATKNILIPNQHIGAWKVGFMPSWLTREYLARRGGARFRPDQLVAARCALLGRTLWHLQIEGTLIPRWFLQVETQPSVGEEAYDKGAEMLYEFFHKELKGFLSPDLDPLGKSIIQCCLDKGSVDDYDALIKP